MVDKLVNGPDGGDGFVVDVVDTAGHLPQANGRQGGDEEKKEEKEWENAAADFSPRFLNDLRPGPLTVDVRLAVAVRFAQSTS